jgi:ABC-2 type transport system permease protein
MIPAIKAEIKKVLTVRSTYGIALFFLLLTGGLSFYASGYKVSPGDLNGSLFSSTLQELASTIAFAGALVSLFLVAHEYRYNTIVYTLSASNSRSKVLAAKILTAFGFTFIYSIIVTALCLALIAAGVAMAGHALPHQDINYVAFFAKTVFTCEAFALFAVLVPTIVRNMQASVAILLIVPNTLEALISIAVKQPEKWLPFRALAQVTARPLVIKGGTGNYGVSPARGAVTFLVYLTIGWIITWYLFLRRDAA